MDVNIAARLCEAAPAGGVLVSGQVREELGDRWPAATATDIWLRGVPEDVSIFFAHEPDGHEPRAGRGAPSRAGSQQES